MAFAYLNDGAISLAAANWSDTTGFADGAELMIGSGSQHIADDLNYSGLSGSVERFQVSKQFTGHIGTAAVPLRMPVDFSADATVEYLAAGGSAYLRPEGNTNNEFENLVINTGANVNLLGGGEVVLMVVENVQRLTVSVDVDVVTAYLINGSGTIDFKSTAITNCYISGGSWIIKRPGTYHVTGNARVTFDIASGTVALNQSGGTVTHVRGDIQTFNIRAGTYNGMTLERETTVGATAGVVVPGAAVNYNSLLSIDAGVVFLGSGGISRAVTGSQIGSFG